MKQSNTKNPTINYIDKMHRWGKIWSVTALCVLFSVPLVFSLYYHAFPTFEVFLKAVLKIIPIYWSTAIIEVLTYTPMLGAGGTYLSFVTGNITNLKLPCALNALDRSGYRASAEEGEVISTIAIAASSITTTVVIAIGVLAFGPSIAKITAPDSVLAPAFTYVIPALFGALGASYFLKHWRISIFPIAVGILVYVFSPTMPVGTMIFVTIVAAIVGALVLFKLRLLPESK